MSDDAFLFDQADGSSLVGYLLLKSSGKNLPPNWVKRSKQSRKSREANLAKLLKKGLSSYATLLDWEKAYRKECFYSGILALFELDREGKTRH